MTLDETAEVAQAAPPGSVIIIRGEYDVEERAAFFEELKIRLPDYGEQLFIFVSDDRAVEVLDEDAMAAAGWFRADAAGDVDDLS